MLLRLTLLLLLALPASASAAVIALYDFENQTRLPDIEAPGVTAGFFDAQHDLHVIFPAGNAPSPLNGLSMCGFVTGNYFEFSVVPDPGHVLALSSLSLDNYSSSTGPQTFDVLVDTGAGFVSVSSGLPNPLAFTTGPMTTVGLGGLAPTTNGVTVRLVGTNATSDLGSWTLDNVQLEGSVSLVPEPGVALLMGIGLVGLAHAGRRQPRRR